MDGTKGVSQTSAAVTTTATTSTQRSHFRRFCSAPIAAQTISVASFSSGQQMGGSESNTNSNFKPFTEVYLWRPSIGDIIGIIQDGPNAQFPEPGTSETALSAPAQIGTVIAQDGDILVAEIWGINVQSSATGYTNTVYYDGTTEGSTSTNAAYIDFGQDIIMSFGAGPITITPGVASATASGPTTSVVERLVVGSAAASSAVAIALREPYTDLYGDVYDSAGLLQTAVTPDPAIAAAFAPPPAGTSDITITVLGAAVGAGTAAVPFAGGTTSVPIAAAATASGPVPSIRWTAATSPAVASASSPAPTILVGGAPLSGLWSVDILPHTGVGVTVADAKFRSARVTWSVDGSGAAELDLSKAQGETGNWLWGRCRIRLRDPAGVVRFQGFLERLDRSGPPGDVSYRASALGLASRLDKQAVHGDFSKTNTVATTIAWNLIQHAQAQTDSDTGFTLGAITGTAPSRTRFYCDGDIISEMINELADLSGGFAWEIGPDGKFNAWVGGRGTDRSGSITLTEASCIDWNLSGDAAEIATYATGMGDAEADQACGPPVAIVNNGQAPTWGRREIVITGENTQDSTEMTERTTEELRSAFASRLQLTTTWIEGQGPWAFGTVWLGDLVTVNLGPAFGGSQVMRLTTVTLTLEPGRLVFDELLWEGV